MSTQSKLILALATISFIVALLRFVPDMPESVLELSRFATGLTVGLAIGLVIKRKDRRVHEKTN